jgi:hypothetical protein
MARDLGLGEPQPGQVVHSNARMDASAPAEAKIAPPTPPVQ